MSQGYRIAFTRVPGSGLTGKPPIVFLHGGPGGYVLSSVIRALAPLGALGHGVYFCDQIGSGLSDRRSKPKDYPFLGHVADVHEIVNRHIAAPKVILRGSAPFDATVPGSCFVLQGACDYIPYASTYEYVALFPSGQYSFFEGAGHIIWWDKPEEYHGRIAQFLEK